MRTEELGIQESYVDALGRARTSPFDVVERARAALREPSRDARAPVCIAAGHKHAIAGAVSIETEDGRSLRCDGEVPDDLPPGYHHAVAADGTRTLLIVSPRRCVLPSGNQFGFALQLHAARSARSWGIGDCADLCTIATWSHSLGARVLLLNPLNAPLPVTPQRASPYSPSSRRYRNPLYIDVESVPGIERIGPLLDSLRTDATRLLEQRRIDRDSVLRLKMQALERLWELQRDVPELDLFIARDPGVQRYATFCALVERHGPDWRSWPEEVRGPLASAVERFRRDNRRRVRFHVWLQWLLDRQLAQAAHQNTLMQDFAVGFDPAGADAWEWQDLVVDGFEIGAPPDELNTQGQSWALSAFDPWRLRSAGYRPFIETIRATLRHAGALRIDHVMGLFRLFWVPGGGTPDQGVYVRYPASDLLDILALESVRADAYIAGEDLGTVEQSVREELAARDVLTYRVLWFDSDPQSYPRTSLGTVTTHDLPTVAGLWDGSDLQEQRDLGLQPNEQGTDAIRARIKQVTALPDDASVADVVPAVYAELARAPSLVLAASLEDMCAVRERPNLPGTGEQRANWSLALPVPVEQLMESPLPARVAKALARG